MIPIEKCKKKLSSLNIFKKSVLADFQMKITQHRKHLTIDYGKDSVYIKGIL